jgi:mannan endo-1,4-beta-mannosidase
MKHRRREPDHRDAPDLGRRDRPEWGYQAPLGNAGGAASSWQRRSFRPPPRHRPVWVVIIGAAIIAAAAIVAVASNDKHGGRAARPPGTLPIKSQSYLGIYKRGADQSYAGVDRLAQAIGRQPNLVTCYSTWFAPFQAGFAAAAASRRAVPLVQLNPDHVRIAAIASGQYDAYLRSYAAAVRAYHRPVVISFGHEMNGPWYPWGYRHTSPAAFVAAWRHIFTLFRGAGARNVTWLWTINVINTRTGHILPPAPWWPGNSYVTWVGIDGYYFKPSWRFAPLFGPTIKAVRTLTRAPILIAETGAGPAAGQPAKIADLFAGIRAYGLLGFVWFDANGIQDWRLDSPAAVAAFRQGAKSFKKPAP